MKLNEAIKRAHLQLLVGSVLVHTVDEELAALVGHGGAEGDESGLS
jgi:hypothetical protein